MFKLAQAYILGGLAGFIVFLFGMSVGGPIVGVILGVIAGAGAMYLIFKYY